ncbi:neutrophil gelatinase-associated lipocalin [Paramormyrops kingsleyae]|uniref:Prostaglandin D2 synthase a n=1 Tax=Paramormyrops kingsleyae TaxID=1676925 RepID=A0A3B3QDQ2_9TELE|nr:lipocalin-like [Paramormyrops kingsleyae]
MRTTALIASLTLLAFGVLADVQPQKDFDLRKFGGKWYRVGLAYDSLAFARYRSRFRISMGTLTPLSNGDAELTMYEMGLTGCQPISYVYEKAAVPGVFKYFSTRHHRVKDIMVVETNYNEYALVLKNKKIDKELTQVALYGRSQKLRPELVEKFREFSLSLGFSRESILTPSATDDCGPA